MSKEYFWRLCEYGGWANRRVLDHLRKQATANERARKWFCHVLAAERVWITRLRGQDSSALPIWPEWSLDECGGWVEPNSADYHEFLNQLGEDGVDHPIVYKNSRGKSCSTPVRDILTHVTFHGTYHRGQIATAMRDAGQEPADTDFITFTIRRSGATGTASRAAR